MHRLASALLFSSLAIAIACGPRYRKEVIGSGQASVSAASAAPQVAGVVIKEGGLHRVHLAIQTPRAMVVGYRLSCPGAERSGQVGETLEQYRERRLAELTRERETKKKLVGAIAGAVFGRVAAGTEVQTPVANGNIEASADGAAVGEAAADHAIAPVALEDGDIGGGVVRAILTMKIGSGGACSLALNPIDSGGALAGVAASFQVERLIDIAAEKEALRRANDREAVAIRGELGAELVALGADPQKRAREHAAAMAREEAERRVRLEAKWRLEAKERAQVTAERQAEQAIAVAARQAELEIRYAEARRRKLALDGAHRARSRVTRWLTECGGDPGRRARLERERRERANQLVAIAIDARTRLRGRLTLLGADPQYRANRDAAEMRAFERRVRDQREAARQAEIEIAARSRRALEARAALKVRLIGDGAIERPGMPAPLSERQTEAPFSGAAWIAGRWQWHGESWVWIAGRWGARPEPGHVWIAPKQVNIGGVVVIRAGGWWNGAGKRMRRVRGRTRR